MTGGVDSFSGPEYWTQALFAHNWPKKEHTFGYDPAKGKEWARRVRDWVVSINGATDVEDLEWTMGDIRGQRVHLCGEVWLRLNRMYNQRKELLTNDV